MKEDLKHIDLIDKYISGTLKGSEAITFKELFENDSDFKKEVEVYQEIYKTIESNEEEKFKKRLDTYYKDYLDENTNKPKGIYRKLVFISGIAATIVLCVIGFNNWRATNIDSPPIKDPIIVNSEIDTTKTDNSANEGKEVIVKEQTKNKTPKTKEISPENSDYNTQLSIGGLKSLPQNAIRSIQYPISLMYTFDGKELTLLGNPAISGLQLQLLKNQKEDYFLRYQNQYFHIKESKLKKRLEPASITVNETSITEEQIKINLQGVDSISTPLSTFKISFTGKSNPTPSYIIEEKESELHLIFDGDLPIKKTNLFKIVESDKTTYFLRINTSVYAINIQANKPTYLKEVNVLSSKLTQLFRENRTLPPKTVYLIE